MQALGVMVPAVLNNAIAISHKQNTCEIWEGQDGGIFILKKNFEKQFMFSFFFL